MLDPKVHCSPLSVSVRDPRLAGTLTGVKARYILLKMAPDSFDCDDTMTPGGGSSSAAAKRRRSASDDTTPMNKRRMIDPRSQDPESDAHSSDYEDEDRIPETQPEQTQYDEEDEEPQPRKRARGPRRRSTQQSQGVHADGNEYTPQEQGNDEITSDRPGSGGKPVNDLGPGTIEEVELVNFMCHTYLQVKFGPNINFVIGHNGSGKSAILTALTVCLGGKAGFTGRGSNIKSLLKEGTSVGSVTVKLRNRGPDAYKPDVYGHTIIVERKISKDGSSGYTIKNYKGETKSKRREDLNGICDNMQIQVDNPLAILTQDTARQFLSNSTPRDKYNFFLTGTQLAQLSADYEKIRNKITDIKSIIEFKRKVLPELKEEFKRADQKIKDLEKAKEMETQVDQLRRELAWCEIENLEANLNAREQEVIRAERKAVKAQEEVDKFEPESKRIQADMDAITAKINENTAAAQLPQSQLKETKTNINNLRQRQNELLDEEGDLQQKINTHERNSRVMEQRIAEEARKLQVDSRAIREQKLAYIESKEQERSDLDARLQQVRMEIDSIERQMSANEARLQKMNSQKQEYVRDLATTRNNISQLQQQSTNRVKAFGGRNLLEVLRTIDEYDAQRRWTGRRHIKVTEPNYAKVVETLISGSLTSFGVENQADLKLLERILNQCGENATIIRYARGRQQLTEEQPDESLLTVLRSIEVDNPIVLMQMVIHHRIDKIVLVKDRKEGETLTSPWPRNVNAVYSPDGLSHGSRLGGLQTQTLRLVRGPLRLSNDVEGDMRESQQREQDLQFRLQSLEAELRDFTGQLNATGRNRQSLRAEASRLGHQLQRLEPEIQSLREDLQEEDPPNISALEEAKRAQDEQAEVYRQQLRAVQDALEQIRTEMAPLVNQMKSFHRQIEQNQAIHNELQDAMMKLGRDKGQLQTRLDHYSQQKNRYEAELQQKRQIYEEEKAEVEEKTREVEEHFERVPVTKSRDELQRLIRQIEARLHEKERLYGSLEKAYEEFEQKKIAFGNAKREMKSTAEFCELLQLSYRSRMKNWSDFRRYVAVRAKQLFTAHLRRRGFQGKLRFNHDDQELDLVVMVDPRENNSEVQSQQSQVPNKKAASSRDPKSLSGGEKSFSTICLLMALWDTMGSPFRALDEFDVFMDAVNRRVSMRLLIDNARKGHGDKNQYILITPQDMGNIQPASDIRVNKLADPERGQTQLQLS
ncbi:Structural maintenance of chromosomes protein 6 [Quaeritorhiza haematococci]|nr:Structural maintenance of chromosomes protein 6 [Quaeritorhiza haematococci]